MLLNQSRVNFKHLNKSKHTLFLLTALAMAFPLIWAHQAPPLPAFFSQWMAGMLWALVALNASFIAFAPPTGALHAGNTTATTRAGWVLLGLLALLIGSLLTHVSLSWTPSFIALPTLFNLILATTLSVAVVQVGRSSHREFLPVWLGALLVGVLIAALYNAGVALVQTVAPNWTNESL